VTALIGATERDLRVRMREGMYAMADYRVSLRTPTRAVDGARGGEGKRLAPLTSIGAKPAVPFAGSYRLIDFALSNLANAGYRKIVVPHAVQEPQPRRAHLRTWRMATFIGDYVTSVPGADAAGAALVPGLGRCDLPEPQTSSMTRSRPTSSCSAPTTSIA
jgi:hypothetical protein